MSRDDAIKFCKSLRSVCLFTGNVYEMKRERNPAVVRDISWYTQTCTLGYSVASPWTQLNENEDINVVCRSNYEDVLAVGDSSGTIKLYKYPASLPKVNIAGIKFLACQNCGANANSI